jgi:hypothetical protein
MGEEKGMQTAIRMMWAGWLVLAVALGCYAIADAYLFPRRDDLGLGLLVITSLLGSCGLAGAIMGSGAARGSYLLARTPGVRTPRAVVMTVSTGVATFVLARVLVWLVWGI